MSGNRRECGIKFVQVARVVIASCSIYSMHGVNPLNMATFLAVQLAVPSNGDCLDTTSVLGYRYVGRPRDQIAVIKVGRSDTTRTSTILAAMLYNSRIPTVRRTILLHFLMTS